MATKGLSLATTASGAFEGEFPHMTPMLSSAWLLTVQPLLTERRVRGGVNIISERVGLFTHDSMWIHQCKPRSLYNRIRKYMPAPVKIAPRAIFSLHIVMIQAMGPQTNQIEAVIVLDGEKELPTTKGSRYFIWNWVRTMTAQYTCCNSISMKDDECKKCGYKLTKQEKTLIILHNLGRQLDARRAV